MLRKLIVTVILACFASAAYAASHNHGDHGTQPAATAEESCPMMKDGTAMMQPCSKEAMELCAKCPHAKGCKQHRNCMNMKQDSGEKPAAPAHNH